MVLVTFSPEAIASFRRLPNDVRLAFDVLLQRMGETHHLRLPGGFPTHQLEGGPNLWTMKVGRYRGIYRWDGNEARFIRFGPRGEVYRRLPK